MSLEKRLAELEALNTGDVKSWPEAANHYRKDILVLIGLLRLAIKQRDEAIAMYFEDTGRSELTHGYIDAKNKILLETK